MSITSVFFVGFIFLLTILYYSVPKKNQWIILLIASISFYLSVSPKGFLYVLITAGSIYYLSLLIDKLSNQQKKYLTANKELLTKEEKAIYKSTIKKKKKLFLLLALVLNIGILCTFKYLHFAIEQINYVLSLFKCDGINNSFSWIAPLGLSFYSFQAVGYIVDIYWGNYKPEKNFFKFLLFVSFFPQITQGPISQFDYLSKELFKEHNFSYKNYSWGFQRMLWGFMKKMLIANGLAPFVKDIFQNYTQYNGIICLIGMFMYSIQIYADFSGYMDIMCGACEILDIRLTENFNRPYFSKSVAEYWRRWHISLGTWFKQYIYYPIAISKWNQKLGLKAQKKLGKLFGQTVSASIALVVVWFATGFWHGASWAYIAWGGVNGLFIIASLWLEPIFKVAKKKMRINEDSQLWKAFQVLRTFIVVTYIKVLPEVGSLKDGLGLIKTTFNYSSFFANTRTLLPVFINETNIGLLMISSFLSIILLVSSLIQRKHTLRTLYNKLNIVIRILITVFAVIVIISFGLSVSVNSGGFMYERF